MWKSHAGSLNKGSDRGQNFTYIRPSWIQTTDNGCIIDTARPPYKAVGLVVFRKAPRGVPRLSINTGVIQVQKCFQLGILKSIFNGPYLFINSCWLLSRPGCFEKFDMKRTLAEWFLEHILAKINRRFLPVWVLWTAFIYSCGWFYLDFKYFMISVLIDGQNSIHTWKSLWGGKSALCFHRLHTPRTK